MYLILSIELANQRNTNEAIRRNCGDGTTMWWPCHYTETECALDVADGEGLTPEEKAACLAELPVSFIADVVH